MAATANNTVVALHPWRELPPGISPVGDFWGFINWAESVSDPRANALPLMSTVYPTLALCGLYICFVVFGSKIMKNREAFELKGLMIAYNVAVIALNAYMAEGLIRNAVQSSYDLVCNKVDYSDRGAEMLHYVYVFYLSKLVDFSDTVFMVLRKKFNQVSFLHVYHHCSMFLIWWSAVKFAGGGDGICGPIMNCFVHMIMYGYYLASCFGINVPGKKYITQIQLLQFWLLMAHSSSVLFNDCPYPHWTMYAQILFCTSLVFLFMNFYRGAYKKKKSKLAAPLPPASSKFDTVSCKESTVEGQRSARKRRSVSASKRRQQ